MKIAIVYDVIYPYVVGGVQLRNWEVAKRLVQRGHEVTLFGTKHWQGNDVIISEGVRLWGVCPAKELYARGRRATWPPIYFSYNVLAPLMKRDFEIVDVSNFPYFPCLPAKLAAWKNRSRLVVTWIEVWGNYWLTYLGKMGLIAKAMERMCAGLSDTAVAISEMTRRDLQKIGFKHHISVIPCGVDFKRVEEVVPSSEASDVIFVGRLIKEKNVDLLIRATGYLARRECSLKCLIVGDGPERGTLATMIRQMGLQESIRIIPFLESQRDVFSYMKSSKVFVLPSSREGFGIIALEANACGLPVITTRYPRNACCELIRDGENGFVCEPAELDVADKMVAVLKESAIPVSNCKQFAKEHDWDDVAVLLEKYYESLIAEADRRPA